MNTPPSVLYPFSQDAQRLVSGLQCHPGLPREAGRLPPSPPDSLITLFDLKVSLKQASNQATNLQTLAFFCLTVSSLHPFSSYSFMTHSWWAHPTFLL